MDVPFYKRIIMKRLLFKDFIKCLKKSQKIFAYGWIRSDVKNRFTVESAPSYYMELPVVYFHFKKTGILNVRFSFDDKAFLNG